MLERGGRGLGRGWGGGCEGQVIRLERVWGWDLGWDDRRFGDVWKGVLWKSIVCLEKVEKLDRRASKMVLDGKTSQDFQRLR